MKKKEITFFILLILIIAIIFISSDTDEYKSIYFKIKTDFGGSDYAKAILIQKDQKIIVAGTSDGDFALARYNIDSSLDKTFGINGKVLTDFGGYDFINSIVIQNDGKIVATGTSDADFALARYNEDGSLDTTFGTSGKFIIDFGSYDECNAITIQSDGKIVIAGTSNKNFALARCNINGSLDNTFGINGKVITDFGGYDYGTDIRIQEDMKLIVLGSSDYNFALSRYNIDGSLDITFGINGKITTNFGNIDLGNALFIQKDGKIIVIGTSFNYECNNFDFALIRYNIDGNLDTTFGKNGKVLTDFGGNDGGNDIAIQFNEKILISGVSEGNFALAKYNANGSLDLTFGREGKIITNFGGDDYGNAIAIQKDGKILIAGESDGNFALVKYKIDGTIDVIKRGVIVTDFGSYDLGSDIIIQLDGKIVAIGSSGEDIALVRYNKDGSLDTTFGKNGKIRNDLGDNDFLSAVAIQKDEKIVVVGSSDGNFILLRYNKDGSLDKTFGINGLVITDFYDIDSGNAIAIQLDGKIVAAGSSGNDFALSRYNIDGSIDTTFGNNGKVITDFNAMDILKDVSIQKDGKIIVVGMSGDENNMDFALARYNIDGSLDVTFGKNGKIIMDLGGYDLCSAISIQSDGKIIVAGSGDGNFVLIRFNINGSLDTTFGKNGKVITNFGGINFISSINNIEIDSNGKIVAAGIVGYENNFNFALSRYNKDGSLDLTFGKNGKVITDFTELDYCFSICMQLDGKIIIIGSIVYDEDCNFILVRYNIDGSVDTTFGYTE